MNNCDISGIREYVNKLLNASKFLVNKKKFKDDIRNLKKIIKYIDNDMVYKIIKDDKDD